MYTPFRLKPRIFPEVVSATVESDAVTTLRPQLLAANSIFEEASNVRCAIVVAGRMPEQANPPLNVAMPWIKERLPSQAGADS